MPLHNMSNSEENIRKHIAESVNGKGVRVANLILSEQIVQLRAQVAELQAQVARYVEITSKKDDALEGALLNVETLIIAIKDGRLKVHPDTLKIAQDEFKKGHQAIALTVKEQSC